MRVNQEIIKDDMFAVEKGYKTKAYLLLKKLYYEGISFSIEDLEPLYFIGLNNVKNFIKEANGIFEIDYNDGVKSLIIFNEEKNLDDYEKGQIFGVY